MNTININSKGTIQINTNPEDMAAILLSSFNNQELNQIVLFLQSNPALKHPNPEIIINIKSAETDSKIEVE